MMRTILFFLLFLLPATILQAQNSTLQIFPDPAVRAQCPEVETTYYIFPWQADCPAVIMAIGGEVLHQEVNFGKLVARIIWHEPVDSLAGRIELQWPDSICMYGSASRSWDFTIISLANFKPVVTGADPIFYMGENNYLYLKASLSAPNDFVTGVTDFEWAAPADWETYSYGLNNELAALTIPKENALYAGCIRVRGKFPCGSWSGWTDFCFQGIIHDACPIRSSTSYFLCSDTTERFIYSPGTNLPHFPQYYWTPTEYTWTVPPGWVITTDNPSSQNYIIVKPDGHTDGTITMIARAGDFSSNNCVLDATFEPADPATVVTGPDYVCSAGQFRLDPLPLGSSEITWQITPVDAATPQVAVPDHGSGDAFFQISDPAVSGFFRITYTISTECGTVSRSKDFFVGKPQFSQPTLDGAVFNNQPLCAGYHGLKSKAIGTPNAIVSWSAAGTGLYGYTQRDSFVFSLNSMGQTDCPVITASAANECGTASMPVNVCLAPDCSPPSLDLLVYPNPAYIIVTLESVSTDAVSDDHGIIEQVEVFNQFGQKVNTWQEPGRRIIKPVVDLPNGVYILRATVWGHIITKRLVIARLY